MTEDPPRVAFYRNKRADTLTRDELLDAYTHAVDELQRMRNWQRQDAEMEQVFRETAARLRAPLKS